MRIPDLRTNSLNLLFNFEWQLHGFLCEKPRALNAEPKGGAHTNHNKIHSIHRAQQCLRHYHTKWLCIYDIVMCMGLVDMASTELRQISMYYIEKEEGEAKNKKIKKN